MLYYLSKGSDFIHNLFHKYILFIIFFTIIISIFFIPFIQNQNINQKSTLDPKQFTLSPKGFLWPLPGYTNISSHFGKRNAPTSGASSFHYGIDIPAPEGSNFIAIHDGQITFCGFLGARWLYYNSIF